MRLFLYYALHSFKNQLRKLFKTWVMVFMLCCVLLGVVIGVGAGILSDLAENDSEPPVAEEAEARPPTEEERQESLQIAELALGAVMLLVFSFNIASGDKNGSSIFTMADVNLLFASPMKPQSVLLFKLMSQLGGILLASIYLVFQLPNLVENLGLSLLSAIALLLGWLFILAFGKLLNVLVYTASSTHERWKKRVRPCIFGLIGLLAASFLFYWKSGAAEPFAAAKAFFNAEWTVYIPVWGWIKAFCMGALESNWPQAGAALLLLIAGAAGLSWLIWRMKADFYEDALNRSAEVAEKLQTAQESGGIVRRKKDRKERIRRDGLTFGSGANIYFYKAMYNRFRFASMGFFTKTTVTYLLAALAAALYLKLVAGYESYAVVAYILAVLVFFRSLGNPLQQDIQQASFRMIPESAWRKIFYSMMGGSVNCILDLLPGLMVAAVILRANLLLVPAWLAFIVSVDFYSTGTGVFIDLSVPVSAGKTIKGMVQILFIYFGLLPDIALIAAGTITGLLPVFLIGAACLNSALGLLFLSLSPQFIEKGSR